MSFNIDKSLAKKSQNPFTTSTENNTDNIKLSVLQNQKTQKESQLTNKETSISNFTKGDNINNAQNNVSAAQTSLSDARSQLSAAQNIPATITNENGEEISNQERQNAIAQAQAAVQSAQNELDRAIQELERTKEENFKEEAKLQAELSQIQDEITDIDKQIAELEINKPQNNNVTETEDAESEDTINSEKTNTTSNEELNLNQENVSFENMNTEEIMNYIQSQINPSTLPENADLNMKRLIVDSNGEVAAISIKLTDADGNPIGNVEYDKNGNIKHIGKVVWLNNGDFKIDEKYFGENGIITSNNIGKENYERNYDLNDFNETIENINNSEYYNMMIDSKSDGVINIIDLQNIGINLYTDKTIKEIKKESLTSEYSNYMNINEQIDDSKQGHMGDCWFLSALNSLSYTEKGRQIIDDAITNNGDGTYTVSFPGVDTNITITDEELQNMRNCGKYSTGDDDVLLMEVATEKVMDLIKNGDISAPLFLKSSASDDETSISGGFLVDIIYLLTGDKTKMAENPDSDNWRNNISAHVRDILDFLLPQDVSTDIDAVYDLLENNFDDYVATMSLCGEYGNKDTITATDVDGNEVVLTYGGSSHAWSIKSVDGDTVTIVNPWDSSTEYTFTKEELKKYVSQIEYYELSNYKGKKDCSKEYKYDCDENGNESKITTAKDKNGNIKSTTADTYDKGGNLKRVVSNYDKNGNIAEVVETEYDMYGFITSYSVIKNEYDDNGNIIGATKKTFDEYGVLVSASKSEFDTNGNEIKTTKTRQDGSVEEVTESEYDSTNNINTKTTTKYDETGEVSEITKVIYDANGGSKSKTYDKNGNLIASRDITKNSDGKTEHETDFTYDQNGNIKTQEEIYYNNGCRSGSSIRTYDENGSEISYKQYHANGKIDNSTETTYNKDGTKTVTKKKYDQDGNVTEKIVEKYDKDGNLIP